jgi:hypothetical protein
MFNRMLKCKSNVAELISGSQNGNSWVVFPKKISVLQKYMIFSKR